MSTVRRLAGVGLLLWVLVGCARPPGGQAEVTVSVAASLGSALTEAKTRFEAANPHVAVRLNTGSSGALAAQIIQGAPVDLVILAAAEPMDRLQQQGLVPAGEVSVLASNQVVLVRPANGPAVVRDWAGLASARRIAVGNPAHVPAGEYGTAVLRHLGLLETVRERLVYGEDARQVLAFVEAGAVDAGVVYRSDVRASQRAVVVAEAPPGSHPPVSYPMALTHAGVRQTGARAFAVFLRSAEVRTLLERHGLIPPD